MSNFKAVIGAQWGDEGKGKLTHLLSKEADYCVRFQGGDNAGHTIVKNEKTFKLRLLPSGILEGATAVIGAGTVVNLQTLYEEIVLLSDFFETDLIENVYLDNNATIILPLYRLIDSNREKNSNKPIGTTKNGIGIAYEDKCSRVSLRCSDLSSDIDTLIGKLETVFHKHKEFFREEKLNILDHIWVTNVEYLRKYKKIFSSQVKDTGDILFNAYKRKNKIVVEGAQGSLLDITHGTYPYVTSSCTTSQGIGSGIGMSLPKDAEIIGVIKAYCTRVGNGPFNTEIEDEYAERISSIGKEVGVVTGRKRRVGWLDLDSLNYVNRLNGFTCLSLMKGDVLDGFDKVFLNYEGRLLEFEGWNETAGKIVYEGLDENYKKFIKFIEDKTGLPIKYISTGKKDVETIYR